MHVSVCLRSIRQSVYTEIHDLKLVPTCLRARSMSIPWFQGAAGFARQSPALPRRLMSIFCRRRVRKASAITRTPSYVSDEVYWRMKDKRRKKINVIILTRFLKLFVWQENNDFFVRVWPELGGKKKKSTHTLFCIITSLISICQCTSGMADVERWEDEKNITRWKLTESDSFIEIVSVDFRCFSVPLNTLFKLHRYGYVNTVKDFKSPLNVSDVFGSQWQ